MGPAALFLFILLSMAAATSGRAVREQEIAEIEDLQKVSETIQKANAKTKTALVHGDIIMTSTKNAHPCTATGCKWTKRWRYVYVPVVISRSYSTAERNIIIRALVTFHSTTCIRFVWKKWWHSNYLFFFSGSGCWSYLGRQRRGQRVSLQRNGCLNRGTIQHEALHALGFHHEHVRSDRDQYVQIMTQNIQPGALNNFVKVATNNLNTPYDFHSVMHYSKFAFSKNDQPTIVARFNPALDFGQATEMNSNDIARVNKLYQCCE